MRIVSACLAFVVCVGLSLGPVGSAWAEGQTFKLTSLEWPPFSGKDLPQQGGSIAVAKAAFEAQGDSLEVTFLPWKRAVQRGLEAPGYVGYFPEYYSADLEDKCLFSDPSGASPLGLVERKEAPISWASLDDLKAYKIGTVAGYVNTADFDALAAEGALKIQEATDDITNLRKVAAGRIDTAVVDANVMNYLLATDASLVDVKDQLQFNAKPLESKKLYVCFRRTPEGEAAKAIYDAGLAQIDADALLLDALKQ